MLTSEITMTQTSHLIYDHSHPGHNGCRLPELNQNASNITEIESLGILRKELPRLPEVSEVDVIRHYTKLSKQNYGIDDGFYPLGSCTMKYNPKLNQDVAAMEGFSEVHPHQADDDCQGTLAFLYDLEKKLCNIFGFSAFSLQPSAGAQGEYTALLIMAAYHRENGNLNKNVILIPDSAHGTNPASVTAMGWKCRTVKSTREGLVDLEDFKKNMGPDVAGMMLTNPNTLGSFEINIQKIANEIHAVDGLLYWDGANGNAVMGYMKPAELGFDLCHLNLHKTFSTPHGGGGPGAGPVGVIPKLVKYLPTPRVEINDSGKYYWNWNLPFTVGKIHSFYGNVGILLRAYVYIKTNGANGLKRVTETTVLLANYMKFRLKDHFQIITSGFCKHEFILSIKNERSSFGVRALDVAKRLMDYGFYPPTIYFPLNVSEAMMIEVPETETIESIEKFVDAMIAIGQEIKENPELVKTAPHTTLIKRLDEVRAVKQPVLTYFS